MANDLRVGLLLGRAVVDPDGREVGHVHDVRLRRDGPVLPGFGAALRIEALLVRPPSIASRLGLDRHDITGPWPLDVWGRRAARRARLVPWHSIRMDTGESLRTTLPEDELEPAHS